MAEEVEFNPSTVLRPLFAPQSGLVVHPRHVDVHDGRARGVRAGEAT